MNSYDRRSSGLGRGRLGLGVADIACRGVELAGKCSSPRPLRSGFNGRGWSECVQLDKGYATVASSFDLARLSFADIAYRGVDERTVGFLSLRPCRRGLGRRGWPEFVQLNTVI